MTQYYDDNILRYLVDWDKKDHAFGFDDLSAYGSVESYIFIVSGLNSCIV